MLRNGRFANEKFFAGWRFEPAAIKVSFRTISLNAARGARMPRVFVSRKSLVNGKGKVAVAGCRDRSRHVVGHVVDDSAPRGVFSLLSPWVEVEIRDLQSQEIVVVL
jgi:hypothetical protein